MMKKIYESPKAWLATVEDADILTVSGEEVGIGSQVHVNGLDVFEEWFE